MDRVRPLMGVCPQVGLAWPASKHSMRLPALLPLLLLPRHGCCCCRCRRRHLLLNSPTVPCHPPWQFDVLWEQLTGREHLDVFGAIKGRLLLLLLLLLLVLLLLLLLLPLPMLLLPLPLPLLLPPRRLHVPLLTRHLCLCNGLAEHRPASCHPPDRWRAGLPTAARRDEAARLLDDVRLTEAGSVRAGAYSGGMKRRLSVAIALLGDPQVGGWAGGWGCRWVGG